MEVLFCIFWFSFFQIGIHFSDKSTMNFDYITTFAYFVPLLIAYLLSDLFSPILSGLALAFLFLHYRGGIVPTEAIYGAAFLMITTSLFSTFASYMVRKLHFLNQELKEKNELLNHLSMIDYLTEVGNRRYFDDHYQRAWNTSQIHQYHISLMICDIDFFKHYNDTFGHLQGDDVLKSIATLIQDTMSKAKNDAWIARYGGEEFVVAIPNCFIDHAYTFAERIREEVESLKIKNPKSSISSYLTISIGLATMIPSAEMNSKELIAQADHALYEAKASGRNKTVVYEGKI